MSPDAALIAGGTFGLILLIVVGLYWVIVVRPEGAERASVRKRIQGEVPVRVIGRGVSKETERLSTIGFLDTLLSSTGPLTRFIQRSILNAGLQVSVGRFILGSATVAMLFAFAGVQFTGILLVGLGAGLLALFLPFMVLRVFATRRIRKFEEQFPEAVELIARSLRAGHALPTGLQLAADELAPPLSLEFRKLYEQQNYGLPLTDALREFGSRIPLIDARFFVTAVLTQREAGGNLAEVLDNLTEVIRERFKIQRQLRVQSAHGRLTGLVLGGLPPALAVALAVRNPEQFKVLFSTQTGIRLVVGAVVLQIVGVFLIRKITNVEY